MKKKEPKTTNITKKRTHADLRSKQEHNKHQNKTNDEPEHNEEQKEDED